MRVTEKMISDRTLASAMRNRERLAAAGEELSSGVRVRHPGDDPVAAGTIIRHNATVARLDSIAQASSRASTELVVASNALQNIADYVTRAKEISVQLSTDTYSAADRAKAVAEVQNLFTQTVATLNSEVAGRYVFGGFQDRTPPFADDGTYSGDDGTREIEIAPGVTVEASINADRAIKGAGGGVDVLASLKALADALASGQSSAVRDSMNALDDSLTQVSHAQTQAGLQAVAFEGAERAAADGKLAAKAAVAEVRDADILDASSRLASSQQALEAALAAITHSNLSLLSSK